ncbi:hypothetical protein I4U23_012610 [Adineta vaga]|nr:hypothetical protein I4U23_012610 [Adineta vaga]
MIDILLLNKVNIISTLCLIIISFYLLKKFFFRPLIHSNDIDDDLSFPTHLDKRSLRPSYARFMRRKLQQDLNNDSCLCIICLNERKTVVLLPCRHLCVCVCCSKKLSTCPICRNEIENLLEVFV